MIAATHRFWPTIAGVMLLIEQVRPAVAPTVRPDRCTDDERSAPDEHRCLGEGRVRSRRLRRSRS